MTGENMAFAAEQRTILHGATTQVRVIGALILREALLRYGRSRLGYLWAVLEPALLIMFITTLFSQFRPVAGSAMDFAIFFTMGVLPFQLFRAPSMYMAQSIKANRPLFNHLPVKVLDVVVARWLLDTATMTVVIIWVIGFQIIFFDADPPHDLGGMIEVMAQIALLSFGLGSCLAVCTIALPAVSSIFRIIMGPAFFLSCVFYSLEAVPEDFRNILVWNPIVHGVEMFRASYLGGYRTPNVDLAYMFHWAVALSFIGVFTQVVAARMRDQ